MPHQEVQNVEILRYSAEDKEKLQLETFGPDKMTVNGSAVVVLNLGCTARWEFVYKDRSTIVSIPHNAALVLGRKARKTWFRKLTHGSATSCRATGNILKANQRMEIVLRQVVSMQILPNAWYQVLRPNDGVIHERLELTPPEMSHTEEDLENSDGDHSHKRQ